MSDEPTRNDGGVAPTLTSNAPLDPEKPAAGGLLRGESVGRYLIIELLGRGGMGEVFTAYDPQLDRRVALKLLRLRPEYADVRHEFRARLLREAQALAQLSHPNVVAVYDVGTYVDDVFIAMEFVDGRSLRAVLKEDKPSAADVLELFLAAGRGLAAAHAAGMVHRDFKPDNVMVGTDGRVRVLDFGLARAVAAGDGEPLPRSIGSLIEPARNVVDHSRDQTARLTGPNGGGDGGDGAALQTGERSSTGTMTPSSRLLGVALTQYGAVMGTPSYMAPEQLAGDTVDARADQFSFCVALFHALYGVRPFPPSDTPPTVAPQVPASSRVPVRIRDAVLRGLALDPAARFPSMDELLAALSAPPRQTWKWIAAGATAAVASGAIVILASGSAPEPTPQLCRGAEHQLNGVWDAAHRTRVGAAFEHASSRGAAMASRVIATVDDYTQRWVAMHTDTCEATRIRGEQSEQRMDVRMGCLQRDLSRLGALVEQFTDHADPAVVDNAPQAVRALPQLADCANPDALDAILAPPSDPVIAAKVATVRTALDHVDALVLTGRFQAAIAPAHDATLAAQALPYLPVQAEALVSEGTALRLAKVFDRAEATTRLALQRAGAGHDTALIARSAIDLIWVVGVNAHRFDEGGAFADIATAMVSLAGDPVELHARLLTGVGALHVQMSQFEAALAELTEAKSLWEKAGGPNHPELLKVLANIAVIDSAVGRFDDSIATMNHVLERQQAVLGSDHPEVAKSLLILGNTQSLAGDFEAARATLERALTTYAHTIGTQTLDYASTEQSYAAALCSLHRCEDALAHHQHALAIREAIHADDPTLAMSYLNIGWTLRQLGRRDEAVKAYQHELAIFEHAKPPNPVDIANTLLVLAGLQSELRRYDEAWATTDRARAIAETSAPELVAKMYASLADIRVAQARYPDAIRLLAHAVELDGNAPSDVAQAGEHLVGLADAYFNSPDYAHAKVAYEHAIEFWTDRHEATPDRLARLWLGVGESDKSLGHDADAIASLQRAIDAAGTGDGARTFRGQARFELAIVIVKTDPARARTLALAARDDLAAVPNDRAGVERWLAQHP